MDMRLQELTFERQVGYEIRKCLDYQKEEAILEESVSGIRGFDFFLPKGCGLLGWPEKTCVELKIRFIYDSFFRIKRCLDRNSDVKRLVVIVKEKNAYLEKVLSKNVIDNSINWDDRIEVISYEDFIKILQSKSKKNTLFSNSYDEELISKEDILLKAKKALESRNVSLFLGAGVSASAGVGTWNALLSHLSKSKRISSMRGVAENIVRGRYIIDMYGNDFSQLAQKVTNFLYKNTHPSKLIESISQVILKRDIESVITYNYDDLLEDYLSQRSKQIGYPIYGQARLPSGYRTPIYHVHGYLPRLQGTQSEIVLGEKEYHESYQEHNNWGNVEQLHALNRNTCFFIGLSMTDPNLRRLLDLSVKDGSEAENAHFVFLIDNPKKKTYKRFMEQTMRDFGINCIWYKNHNDLPALIDRLV